MEHLERLLDHLGWADQRVFDAVREATTADPAALELLSHVLAAEHVWHARLVGQPPAVAVWPNLSLADCQRLAGENLAGFRAYVATLDPASARAEVTYTNSAGQTFASRVEDILLHVCLHGAYHRGQIAVILRTSGSTPAATDYIAFVRGAPAAGKK